MILIMCLLFQTEGGSDGEKKLERRERERETEEKYAHRERWGWMKTVMT